MMEDPTVPDDMLPILQELRFFDEFPNATLRELVPAIALRSYSQGDVIFREGD